MNMPLQGFFQAIAQAQTEADLHQGVMAQLGEHFAANRWRLWFLKDLSGVETSLKTGLKTGPKTDTPTLLKRALSLDTNPVLRYLVERHCAVHDEVILPPGVWQTICPMPDHGHVMVGPVITQGVLEGGIAFTRRRGEPPFNADDLADLSALSLHISTRLAVLSTQANNIQANTRASTQASIQSAAHTQLTPRETQIAGLVAQGLTNKKVGAELWITENSVKQALKRIFRKLKVSSRAEMVAQLATGSSRVAIKQETLKES